MIALTVALQLAAKAMPINHMLVNLSIPQGSDDDVLMIDGELVTAGRGQGRGSFKSRRKMRRVRLSLRFFIAALPADLQRTCALIRCAAVQLIVLTCVAPLFVFVCAAVE